MLIFTFIYSLVLLFFSAWSYLYVDWHLELLQYSWYKNLQTILWNFSLNQRVLSASFYVLIIFVLYALYFLFLFLAKQKKVTSKNIIILGAISSVILFFSHPALSHDIFNYIMSAKIVTFYHENPWMVMPIEFIKEPMLNFLHAGNKIVLYGPVWVLITLIPSSLGQNNFLLTFGLFKILVLAFYAGSAWLIYRINKEQKNAEAIQNLIFFAFNPLVLIETLSSSHNDIVMMFFVLLSFYLLMKKNFLSSIVYFLFSVAIKYASIILLPLYLFLVYKINKKETIDWEKIFSWAAILMFIVFLLSPLREELYPWYLIWTLGLVAVTKNHQFFKVFLTALSFGLLMRYVPFMLTYDWFGYTPLVKKIVTLAPCFLVTAGFWGIKYLRQKNRTVT